MSQEQEKRVLTTTDHVIGVIFMTLGFLILLLVIFRWSDLRAMKIIPIYTRDHTQVQYLPLPQRARETVSLAEVKVYTYTFNGISKLPTGFYEFVDREGHLYVLDFCPVGEGKHIPDFEDYKDGKSMHFKQFVFSRYQNNKPEECQTFVSAIMDREATW